MKKEGEKMFDVLITSLTFILIIVIAYFLKKVKVLKKSDANILATIIMNVTLPCALLTSANGITLDMTTSSAPPMNTRFARLSIQFLPNFRSYKI